MYYFLGGHELWKLSTVLSQLRTNYCLPMVDSLVTDVQIRKKCITLKHLISFLMHDIMRKLAISRAEGYVEVVKLVFLLFCMFTACKAEWKWGRTYVHRCWQGFYWQYQKLEYLLKGAEPNIFYWNGATSVLLEYGIS